MKYLLCLLIVLFCRCNSDIPNKKKQESIIKKDSSKFVNHIAVKNESFYDFFYNFQYNQEFRKSRITNKEWSNLNYYFINEYTINICECDTSENCESQYDNSIKKVYSIISADANITNFYFKKENNLWIMNGFEHKISDFTNNAFIKFYYKFCEDSNYQKEHVCFPIKSTFLDYDNDYKDTTMYFAKEDYYYENYLQNNELLFLHNGINIKGDYASVLLRGIDNGISVKYYFKFINGNWMLIEERNYST